MAALGVMGEAAAGRFDPDGSVSRLDAAAALAALWRAAGRDCEKASAAFSDVAAADAADVECMHAAGVLLGTAAGVFSPDEALSRAQAAVMLGRLWRALGGDCPASQAGFSDVGAAHFAAAEVDCQFALGVTRGATADLFDPDGVLTRAQTAALQARMWRLHSGSSDAASVPAAVGGHAQVTLSWPAAPGAAGYRVQYRAGYSGQWADWPHNSTATTAVITGLANGVAYQARVGAVSQTGDITWSPPVAAVTQNAPALPAAPAVTPGNAQLTVRWSPPQGTPGVTGYDVQYREDGDIDWSPVITAPGADATTAVIGNLRNGRLYHVRARHITAAGPAGWSATAQGTPVAPAQHPPGQTAPDPSAPGAPVITFTEMSNSGTLQAPKGTLQVVWAHADNQGSPVLGYDLQYRRSGPSAAWNDVSTGPGTSTHISGLFAMAYYEVRVRAVTGAGAGPWSPTATSAPAGAGTQKLTITAGDTSLRISWQPPADTSDLNSYTIAVGRVIDTGSELHYIDAPTTSITVTGLTPGTAYRIEVSADNTGSLGWATATTSGTPPTSTQPPDHTPPPTTTPPPSKPHGSPRVYHISTTQKGNLYDVTVGWDRMNANPEVTHYEFDVRTYCGRKFKTTASVWMSGKHRKTFWAYPGETLRMWVQAVNDQGRSGTTYFEVTPPGEPDYCP